MELTKDSQKLLAILYKHYLEKRKNGFSKSDANKFGNSHDIHEQLCSEWFFQDVDDTCRELSRVGLLNCFYADNIAYYVQLTDTAIIYMETRFKNGIIGVAEFIANII